MSADNMPQAGKKQASQDLKINDDQDWAQMRSQWAKERMQKLEAYADKYFVVDEEIPLHKHILLSSIFAFFLVFIAWASFAGLDETTRGEGQVIPSSEIQILQSLEGGIVDKFLAKEGDEVKQGQVIVRLKNIQASSELGSNEARYYGLLASTIRLQAEADGKLTVEFPEELQKKAPQAVMDELNAFTANKGKLGGQLSVLEQQLAQRKQEVQELTIKSRDLSSVISLSRQEKNMIAPLVAKGSAPRIELVQLERGIVEKETELNSVKQAIPRAQAAIEEANARINEMTKTTRATAQTELAAKMIELNAVKESLGALEDRKDRTAITSPVRGIIKDYKINTEGGVVKPGDPIAEIVPKDDQLLVEAKIKPADIAFIYPKQPAMVKITAYDFAIYGGLKAEVVDISADTIKNEKGESFYRVKVRTFENKLKRKGEILPIIPGMVATVDILTGEKTVMEYLMKPFIKTMKGSMNER